MYYTKAGRNEKYRGFDLGDQWDQLVEESKNQSASRQDDMNLTISDESNSEKQQDQNTDEFYIRISKNFEMYCPDKIPQSLKISTSAKNSNWSNPFIMRFNSSSCLTVNQSKNDIIKRGDEKNEETVGNNLTFRRRDTLNSDTS